MKIFVDMVDIVDPVDIVDGAGWVFSLLNGSFFFGTCAR